MKRILAIVLIVVTGLCLTCCKETPSSNESNISDITDVSSENEIIEETESEETSTEETHTHSYNETTVDPTCVSNGYTKHACDCGYSYNDNTKSKLGHSYGEWVTITPASSTNTGLRQKKCSRCGATESETLAKTSSDMSSFEEWASNLTQSEREYLESTGANLKEMYDKLAAVDICSRCGGKNGPYHYWYKDVTCPNCGVFVCANTCHNCN